eukprot:TRINITY_DN26218_c0_g1_i1.p1 TRINITY_DN26218_c0_g1~~TRINITY_DN26218_c0_g1_i1.p1  ORF type:complete len:553 (+),score=98.61 TRINITY_DN26218_c0_g1_i1:170-1660(+)
MAALPAPALSGDSASRVPRPKMKRVSRFDLASEADSPERISASSLSSLLEAPDEGGQRQIRLDAISAKDVASQWPPPAMVDKGPIATEAKRQHLWIKEEDQDEVGAEDVGRFVRLTRNELIENLPEGGCGELARDLTLIPSRSRDVGLMLRKLSVELIMQLSELRDAKNSKGEFSIDKAGFLIDGHKGTGKSQVLNLLAIWARRNGWLVVLEPTPSRYAKEIADIKRSNNGVYIQNEFSQQFLEAMSLANRHMLEEIPIDREAYGSKAIDGESQAVTRRLYEPLIEKTVNTEVENQGLSGIERLQRIAAYKRQVRVPSMVDVLPEPQNVWEIVEFGLENEAYATQAVAETLLQLQRQTTHPVLVMVDEWNECFPCSEYVSIRYDNTRFNGYIPAYHLSMPRALHRWDGHKYRRGLKICATSWMRAKRRDYRPELLGVKDHEIRTVRNFTQTEFANYVVYMRLMNVLHNFPAEDLEYYYMLTQGNGWQSRRLLSALY